MEFSYFLFWGSGSALGFNILLKRGTGFLSSLRLSFSTTFFFVIFSYLVLKFQEFTVPYLRPEKAVELKTNQALQVRSFVKLV